VTAASSSSAAVTTPTADGKAELRQSAWSAWAALAASSSTLICCALPALLVALGAGAALSSLVSAVPQLVWLSEHKGWVFGISGVLLASSAALQWRNRHAPCPIDPALARACMRTRRWSAWVLGASAVLWAVGFAVAVALPWWWAQSVN
jgi:hypothetical protein